MGPSLEALHRLQSIELQLAAMRRSRQAKARQVRIHKREVDQAEQRFQENHLILQLGNYFVRDQDRACTSSVSNR